MHEIYELKEMLCKELEEYGRKGEISTGTLEVVDKLAHTVKNLCKIIEFCEDEEGYSGNYVYENGGGSYERGGNGSYARGGRGSYAYARGGRRRDSMGRYSRENGYSRAGDVEEMVNSIRSMMDGLPQEVQKDARRFVEKLEQQM